MTVEELARAMEKDIGKPDKFIRKNREILSYKYGLPGILFAVRFRYLRMKIRLWFKKMLSNSNIFHFR